MLLNLKKTIFFILRFSAYGLALAFLFLLLSNNISLIDKSSSSFFKLNRHSFNNAVESTAPAVVNVYANKVYQEKGHSVFGHPMFKQFFGASPQLTKTRRNNSIGSGVIMNKAGYILTNAHVIENAENIGITLNSGEQLQAKLIGLDLDTDLAVIKINLKNPPSIKIGDSSKLKIGDIVLAIGNPYNFGQTVTQGIVSATSRKRRGISFFDDFIQTDADINQGHSGGALINVYGELIGINTAIISKSGGSEGIGLATPINQALNVMDEIIKNGKVVRGWLGIEAQSLSGKLRSYEDTSGSNGVLITATIRNGPAENAGIIPGDVIHSVNGERTDSPGKIIDMITKLRPGEKVKIKILRGWDEQELTATILERPAIKFLR
tara:strand:+ start:4078 stop:5214 length:1137 start_codon:yes stop_codon:yes gene_type:complete